MNGKLFKRFVSGALALLMVGTALPAGSDFTGLFGGSDITASAQTPSANDVVYYKDNNGTMRYYTKDNAAIAWNDAQANNATFGILADLRLDDTTAQNGRLWVNEGKNVTVELNASMLIRLNPRQGSRVLELITIFN